MDMPEPENTTSQPEERIVAVFRDEAAAERAAIRAAAAAEAATERSFTAARKRGPRA